MACAPSVFDEPAITHALANAEQRFEKAQLLLQAIQALDQATWDEIKDKVPNKANKFQFAKEVEEWYKKSKLFKDSTLTQGYFNPSDNRLTPEADAKMRQLAAQYPWFRPRENSLRATADFMASTNTSAQIMAKGNSLVEEFAKSITSNHSIHPFEAVVFIAIMHSFVVRENIPSFQPQLLLWLCHHILMRTPGPQFYQAFNWITLLPHADFIAMLKGVQPPINPDIRITDIGSSVLRITSFPLMPDSWGLMSWNSHQLNLANDAVVPMSGNASSASSMALDSKPMEPFPIFRPASTRERGSGAHVLGMEELNNAIAALAVGGNTKGFRLSVSSDGTIDLKPLAKFLSNLTKDSSEKPHKSRGTV